MLFQYTLYSMIMSRKKTHAHKCKKIHTSKIILSQFTVFNDSQYQVTK